jgi:hypothetical protein
MTVVAYPDIPASLGVRGKLGFGRGYGASEYGHARHGASTPQAGIYQRRLVGLGSTLAPRKQAGRYSLSRSKFYRPTNTQQPAQQAWRAIYGAGVGAYRALSDAEKLALRKRARNRNMSGYNLFMASWLHSRR